MSVLQKKVLIQLIQGHSRSKIQNKVRKYEIKTKWSSWRPLSFLLNAPQLSQEILEGFDRN